MDYKKAEDKFHEKTESWAAKLGLDSDLVKFVVVAVIFIILVKLFG
jgi:hypothetical protein